MRRTPCHLSSLAALLVLTTAASAARAQAPAGPAGATRAPATRQRPATRPAAPATAPAAAGAQRGAPPATATATPSTGAPGTSALQTQPPAAAGSSPAPGNTAAGSTATPGPTPGQGGTPPAAPGDLGAARDMEGCPGPRIVRVRFTGLTRVAAADIRGSTHATEGSCFVREQLSRDARALWDLGFFSDVQVAAEPTDQGGVEVRFVLVERPSIHEVRVQGNDAVEEDKIREVIELREGSVVSETAVRRTNQRIRDLYAEKGYFLAEVTYEIVRRSEDNDADIVFHIREGSQVQVRSIQFVGNVNVSSEDLRGSMTTNTAGLFSFLTSAGTYREEAFRNDIDLLNATYYDRGYLNVEIENPRVALSPDRRYLDITIQVREGPRYRVGRVNLEEVDESDEPVEPLGGRRRVRQMLHAEPDSFFSRSVIGRDIQAIQTYYRDGGYASVEITPNIQPHVAERVVDLGLRVRRGPPTYIHRIVIRGNQKTSDRVIRREMQILEGDRYSETRYQFSRRAVMALGYFERVDLSTEPVEGHPERIVVNVEVVERPTGTFQVGAGFSSVETFIATAQIQQLNLFGRGQSLTFQAQISGLRQIFALRFVEPYLWDSNWTGAIDIYNSQRAYTDFTRSSTGGSLSLGYPLIGLNDLRLFFTYTGEQVGVRTGSASIFGQSTGPSAFQRLPLARLFLDGFTSSLGVALAVDTRDNRLYPTSGVYARLGVDYADTVLGSQNIYTRWSGFFRYYIPLFAGVVLKTNINGGVVTSTSDRGVPIFERYFLGGILDVRGFNLRTIGPRLQLPSAVDPNAPIVASGAPIGGNIQFYYNLEVEFPILTQVGLRGVVFTDGGNVWNTEAQFCNGAGGSGVDPRLNVTSPCLNDPFALRTSWGFGLRWLSPLGLLRFEWGFPFAPLPFEQSSNFQFTIGNFF